MAETSTIIHEGIDGIPLLLAQPERIGVQPLLNEHQVSSMPQWVRCNSSRITRHSISSGCTWSRSI
jgi:hypothetical protein